MLSRNDTSQGQASCKHPEVCESTCFRNVQSWESKAQGQKRCFQMLSRTRDFFLSRAYKRESPFEHMHSHAFGNLARGLTGIFLPDYGYSPSTYQQTPAVSNQAKDKKLHPLILPASSFLSSTPQSSNDPTKNRSTTHQHNRTHI